MAEKSKISYKIYLNDRLKDVFFHGQRTLPLYIQVIFERNNTILKSYYFDLFSQPRYANFIDNKIYGPTIDLIKEAEKSLVEFIINKLGDTFTLERFKQAYAYYCKDLLDLMIPDFTKYLYVFLQDEGLGDLAVTINEGAKWRTVYNTLKDLSKAFQRPLYKRLIENSFIYAPPYIPLFEFTKAIKDWPMLSLSVMEWSTTSIQEKFKDFLLEKYPNIKFKNVEDYVEKYI